MPDPRWMGGRQPDWWPEGESWPPGRHGDRSWTGMRRRVVRFVAAAAFVLFVAPIAIAVGLAAAFGGWTAVAIVLICWIGLLLVAAIAAGSLRRAFGPLRDLVTTTDRLADGDYSARVEVGDSRALQPVARSVNTMAERLEASDRLRQQLLADVGHELRTPLTVIRGSLEAMADGVRPVDDDQLRLLLSDIDVMERLLGDLQTLSAAEAGRLKLHREPVDLVQLVEDVTAGFGPNAAPGVAIVATTADTTIEPVDVDEHRIREVLGNLVTNAQRATSPGAGTIRLHTELDDSDVVITVADDGVGMTEDEQGHAFDRFHKGPGSDGSGLGLAISRDLVEAHGGSIELDSVPGEGTIVTVRLPTATG